MKENTIEIGYKIAERLSDFAVKIFEVSDKMPKSFSGKHLASQIVRSGSSPVLNYAEARGAASDRDFVHKLNIALKELYETRANLELVKKAKMIKSEENLDIALAECNELISIFTASIKTVKKRMK